MPVDYAQKLEMTVRMIAEWGSTSYLRRNGANRACIAFETNRTARDDNGQVINPLSVVVYLSPDGLTVDPNHQLDAWVDFSGKIRRMTAQQKKFAPNGTALFWEIKVMA